MERSTFPYSLKSICLEQMTSTASNVFNSSLDSLIYKSQRLVRHLPQMNIVRALLHCPSHSLPDLRPNRVSHAHWDPLALPEGTQHPDLLETMLRPFRPSRSELIRLWTSRALNDTSRRLCVPPFPFLPRLAPSVTKPPVTKTFISIT